MTTVRYTRDPAKPARLGAEAKARLKAMSDADAASAAETDLDNLPLSGRALLRLKAAQVAKSVRAKTGLSQTAFADTFHIKVARLRDLEQGRVTPDPVLVSFLALIEEDPKRAAELVGKVHAAE